MTNLINISVMKMTSQEIADLTGKEHRNVMRDIRAMLVELHGEDRVHSFEHTVHRPNPSGGAPIPSTAFSLPRRETLILISGYSITMRARIIDRFEELEAAARLPQVVSAEPPGKMSRMEASRIYCDTFAMARDAGMDAAHAHRLAAQTKYEASGWWWRDMPVPSETLLAGPGAQLSITG